MMKEQKHLVKPWIRICVLLVFLLLFGVSGCVSTPQSLGNTSGNTANYAYRVEVGDDIVFANSRDHFRIYRSQQDLSEVIKISDRSGVYLNTWDDWIYFMEMEGDHRIVRVRSDGSDEEVFSDTSVFPYGGMILSEGWIYYVNQKDGNRIYQLSLDGSVNKKLMDVSALRLNGYKQNLIYIDSDAQSLMSLGVDGGDIRMLAQDVGELTLVAEDWVYFNKVTDNHSLYRVKTDGSGEMKVGDLRVFSLNVHQGRLYFSDLNHNYRLSSAKLDGSDVRVIREDSSSDILFIHGWLYYLNHSDSGREYRIKGNDREAVISVARVSPLSADESEFEGVGNSNANHLSGGFFVEMGDKIVFAGISPQMQGMYSVDVATSSVTRISVDQPRSLNRWKDWVYYINESDASSIYRMRADGSETQLVLDQSVGNLMIKGNWMYFISHSDNQRIYRARVDGSQLSAVSQAQGLFSFSIDGDWLVFASSQGQTMIKVKLDGSDEQIVTSIASTYITTHDGWIYYGDDNSRVALSKVGVDGQNNQMLIRSLASNVHTHDEYIFYVDNVEEAIMRMDLDGSNITRISEKGDFTQTHSIGDRLFVFDNREFQWISMDFNGKDIRILK